MSEKDAEDLLRDQTFDFLVRFSDDVLETAANRLASEQAYRLLRDLSYEDYAVIVRKILTANLGVLQ